jgi:DNA-binding LytR/AlgR family response regulator
MRIFVVEDEEVHLDRIKLYIDEAGYEFVGFCMDADTAFEKIKNTNPELVLVDIALPGLLNGITLSEKINKELGIPHIFTTSFQDDEVIKNAVATNPKGYLTKPINLASLKAAIKIAFNSTSENSEVIKENSVAQKSELLLTRVGDRLVKIPVHDIKYMKADGHNYTSVFLGKKELSCRTSIKKMLHELPANFIQIHRSVVINVNFLESINENNQTACIDGEELSVSRFYRKKVLAAFRRI